MNKSNSRKLSYRPLYNAYAFIFIPFAMLCLIKAFNGKYEDIIMSTDWSVASFIIFSQSLGTMPSAFVKSGRGVDGDALTSYVIKVIVLGLIPSLYLYFRMNTEPNIWAGWGQVVMFIYASLRFFIDGRTAQKLATRNGA